MQCAALRRQRRQGSTDYHASVPKVDAWLEKLPLEAQDDIFNVTCRLCGFHEKKVFRDGLLVGFHLCGELLGY
jgi:hypothetical protein